ncbi:MAG TPA: acetate/propionate family kinase [Candidatus Acidoferrales bacterium]|nr:acetate/propionate family kinase [Candidatus Acidoferrales bacterium]
MSDAKVLALNGGSSSLKFGLFEEGRDDVEAICSGEISGIGTPQGQLIVHGTKGEPLRESRGQFADLEGALAAATQSLEGGSLPAPTAVAHRVVHGGPRLLEHHEITPNVLRDLETAAVFAPLHVPQTLCMIRESQKHFPSARQFACFDTAFHRTMPVAASRFALPKKFWDEGIKRYGFHGLSCESILHGLGGDVPPRLIVAHLGSGASITAIENGCSMDTTMGLTPTGGIVMSTRSGDLDPGVLLHLMRTAGSRVEELERLLDHESGLLGISGRSGDMRVLHQAAGDADARLAIEIFCRSSAKAIGGFAAMLGGVDLLVFTGGIGEHDPEVRGRICEMLGFMDVAIDTKRNATNSRTISTDARSVRVSVIESQEEAQMARHAFRLIGAG